MAKLGILCCGGEAPNDAGDAELPARPGPGTWASTFSFKRSSSKVPSVPLISPPPVSIPGFEDSPERDPIVARSIDRDERVEPHAAVPVELLHAPASAEPNASAKSIPSPEMYGMFTLTSPSSGIGEGDVVDIFAVHGLGGHYERTWTSKSGGDSTPPCNWLKDLLPDRVPNARIMSFGYNSAVALSRSIGDVKMFGEQLLNKVLQERRTEQERKRSVIFICHSLGGIVLKKVFEPDFLRILVGLMLTVVGFHCRL